MHPVAACAFWGIVLGVIIVISNPRLDIVNRRFYLTWTKGKRSENSRFFETPDAYQIFTYLYTIIYYMVLITTRYLLVGPWDRILMDLFIVIYFAQWTCMLVWIVEKHTTKFEIGRSIVVMGFGPAIELVIAVNSGVFLLDPRGFFIMDFSKYIFWSPLLNSVIGFIDEVYIQRIFEDAAAKAKNEQAPEKTKPAPEEKPADAKKENGSGKTAEEKKPAPNGTSPVRQQEMRLLLGLHKYIQPPELYQAFLFLTNEGMYPAACYAILKDTLTLVKGQNQFDARRLVIMRLHKLCLIAMLDKQKGDNEIWDAVHTLASHYPEALTDEWIKGVSSQSEVAARRSAIVTRLQKFEDDDTEDEELPSNDVINLRVRMLLTLLGINQRELESRSNQEVKEAILAVVVQPSNVFDSVLGELRNLPSSKNRETYLKNLVRNARKAPQPS